MAASTHNFILVFNELNIIQGLLRDAIEKATDSNSKNSLTALHTKLNDQLYSGYPAKDYPFWRNYFDNDVVTLSAHDDPMQRYCGDVKIND